MSRKTNSNSKLDQLPPHQREQLERWLFEENLSYADAVKRCWEDFSLRVSPSTLSEWRQRRARERTLERIAQSSETANRVMTEFKANPANTYDALLHLIGQAAFDARMSGDQLPLETLKELAELTQLGLVARHHAQTLELKREDLDLKRRKFEFSAAKMCLAELPSLKAIANDKSLSDEARIEAIRQKLFGEAAK